MRYSSNSGKGRFVIYSVVLALFMSMGATPALGVIETPGACPDGIERAGFTDLFGFDSTTRHAIDCLAAYNITRGTSTNTFSPNEVVTRWQMALFLIRQAEVHEIDLPSRSGVGYTDIGELDSATQVAINQLNRLGIAKGTSSTTFSPYDSVTRRQMALFLVRLLDEAGVNLPSGSDQGFADVRVLTSEEEIAINQLIQLDVSEGTSSTTFSPNREVTRWQMALFLTRALEADDVTPPEDVLTGGLGGGTTTETGAPELEDVSFDEDDSTETRLNYRFNETVSADIDDGQIWLVGWNGDLINPNDVEKSDDDNDTVWATFFNEDYDHAVAGAVTGGAVFDVDNFDNVVSSDGLKSVTVDSLDWPDDYPELTDVGQFDSDDETVEFEFDQEADLLGVAADFVLIEQDGTIHTGDVVVGVEDVDSGDDTITVITVEFTGLSQSEWNDVVRGYVDDGTVEQRGGGLVNPMISVDVSDSGRTDAPYLTGVDLTDAADGIVVFEFNEDVKDINSAATSDFVLIYHDGTTETAGTADRNDNDPNEVEVDYGGSLDSDVVIYATVLDGAVTGFADNDDNQVDTFQMEYRFSAGDTAGPDLDRITGDGSVGDTYVLTLEFDEDVDLTSSFDPDTDLLAWDEDGDPVALSGGEATIDGDTIEVEFVDPDDDGAEELLDGDVAWIGVLADTIADEFGFTSYPSGDNCCS